MSDKLVFDLAQEVEGSPNVFVRKDWLNILDNQNQNYNNNQSIIDTSQLSNSNKYMSYREAYLSIPFVVTVASNGFTTNTNPPSATTAGFAPATAATSADHCLGLKNWFGQIIHSFTLDYNGTTIVQQTPYINMWNSFKLMTSLSYGDVITQGATIGFYPDDPLTWSFNTGNSPNGVGTCNNTNYDIITSVAGSYNNFKSDGGNHGFLARQQYINFDCLGTVGTAGDYASMIYGGANAVGNSGSVNLLWKSYITNRRNQTVVAGAQTVAGFLQYSIVATVYLKHIHSFFNMCPLLKGVFMKMTMNLNNTSTSFTCQSTSAAVNNTFAPLTYGVTSVSNPLGGVNPLMLASGRPTNIVNNGTIVTGLSASNGGASLFPFTGTFSAVGAGSSTLSYIMNISVGATVLDNTLNTLVGQSSGTLSKSVYLYIPAYTFNPVFEQAYLSTPVKQIKYTDVYQYQVLNVASGGMINNLLTNGIANVKSVLVLPYFNTASSGFANGPVWQSPFDPAGTGPTSPMSWITNFNIQVSGQNAIYNLEKYNFEQFNNQLYGQNSVNGGLTDGITSGLVDRQGFDMEYCYYYVNVERMLPVESSVPKSIQLIGQNMSSKIMDYICFIEYGVEVSIDALTGARV
jgi:hypothetical protein